MFTGMWGEGNPHAPLVMSALVTHFLERNLLAFRQSTIEIHTLWGPSHFAEYPKESYTEVQAWVYAKISIAVCVLLFYCGRDLDTIASITRGVLR